MVGGLLQIVSVGYENLYLNGDPEITFFKIVYRRHSNFSLCDNILKPKGGSSFGNTFTIKLERFGDLLHKMYLVIQLPNILLSFPTPTRARIKETLQKYGIIWDFTPADPLEIVTYDIYNNELILTPVINNYIIELLDQYNYYVERLYIINNSTTSTSLSGRQYATQLFFDAVGSINDNTILSTTLYNQTKTYEIVYKGFIALYNDLLTLKSTLLTDTRLYNADNIRIANYNEYLRCISTGITDVNATTTIGIGTLGNTFNGDTLLVDDNVVFYHILDTSTYNVLPNQVGTLTQLFMNNIVTGAYNNFISPKMTNLQTIDGTHTETSVIKYDNLDSYIVFNRFLSNLSEIDKNLTTTINLLNIKSQLINNIYWNPIANLTIMTNILQVLRSAIFYPNNHFRFGFYRKYTKTNSDTYVPTGSVFSSLSQSTVADITDNFISNIQSINIGAISSDVSVYFQADSLTFMQNFAASCQNLFRDTFASPFLDRYELWERLTTGNSVMANRLAGGPSNVTTNGVNFFTALGSSYSSQAIMNYTPFLVVRDIPIMMQDILNANSFTFLSPAQNDNLKALLNMIDDDERTDATVLTDEQKTLKYEMYERVGKNIIAFNYPTIADPLTTIDTNYFKYITNKFISTSNDYILTALYRPEGLFHLVSYVLYDSGLGVYYIQDDSINPIRYLPVEWICNSYKKWYEDTIDAFSLLNGISSTNTITIKNLINQVINCFKTPLESLPTYEAYVANGYTLYGINSLAPPVTNTQVKYADTISSIWYGIQRKCIQNYNNLLNNQLISNSYYYNNLGGILGGAFDYFKSALTNPITFGYEYYDNTNPYYDTSSYSAVPNEGFDFYRIRIPLISSDYDSIVNYIGDLTSYYSFLFTNYNNMKNILNIRTDYSNLIYNDGITTTLLQRESYYYETSQNINDYIKSNVLIKYINLTTIPISIQADMTNIIITSHQKLSDSFLGALDSVNTDLSTIVGLPAELSSIDTLFFNLVPAGLATFYPELTLWYNTFNTDPQYGNAISNPTSLLNNIIDITTSSTIYNNRFLTAYYNGLKNYEDIVLFFADSVIRETLIGGLLNNISLSSSITKTQFYNTINTNIINIQTALFKITQTKPTFNPIPNPNYQYPFILVSADDIYLYEITDGQPVIGSEMEQILLNLISNRKPQFAWVKELGHKLLSEVSIQIGDQEIDMHNSILYHLMAELTTSYEQLDGYNKMIGNIPDLYTVGTEQRFLKKLWIPLRFWLNNDAGNSLPMISLLHTDVILKVKISNLEDVLYTESGSEFLTTPKLKCHLIAQYGYVEEEERKKFASTNLEYLINKYVFNGTKVIHGSDLTTDNIVYDVRENDSTYNLSTKIIIKITNPVKYLLWTVKFYDTRYTNDIDKIDWQQFGYNVRDSNNNIITIKNPVKYAKIQFFGQDRETYKDSIYYKNVVPYATGCGSFNSDGKFMYSFSLYPLLSQPSGSANFGQLENVSLYLQFNREVTQLLLDNPSIKAVVNVWGCCNNILRIISGMAGLAFFGKN